MSSLTEANPVSFIHTADRARAKPFYEGTLGLPIIAEDPFAVTFALAGGSTLRLADLPGHRPLHHTVLGWAVADIRAAASDLAGRGVTFRRFEGFGQDEDAIWTAPGGGAQVAWFGDPDGNVLSLTQFS